MQINWFQLKDGSRLTKIRLSDAWALGIAFDMQGFFNYSMGCMRIAFACILKYHPER